MRISARLLDAVSGEYLWADRFDGDLEDVFDLQDRITEKVVAVVERNLWLKPVSDLNQASGFEYFLS